MNSSVKTVLRSGKRAKLGDAITLLTCCSNHDHGSRNSILESIGDDRHRSLCFYRVPDFPLRIIVRSNPPTICPSTEDISLKLPAREQHEFDNGSASGINNRLFWAFGIKKTRTDDGDQSSCGQRAAAVSICLTGMEGLYASIRNQTRCRT